MELFTTKLILSWVSNFESHRVDPLKCFLLSASYRFTIERAMKTIQSVSCVQFKEYQEPYWPWEKKHHHLKIINETGCWSIIGSTGRGSQELSLGPGCRWHGTVLHELMHALGFGHMHCNRNRDKYIRIHWDNIEEEKVHNFELLDPYWYEVSIFDYSSIMLYGSRSFSKDGSITMEHPLGGRLSEPYEKGRLSNNDIYYLNKLYNCPVNERVPLETPRTEYRG